MKKIFTLILLFTIAFNVKAQISITATGVPYTQNFNTIATTGTSATLPAGWAFTETGTNANTTYTANAGAANAGDTYSYGTGTNTERALGGLRSGSLVPTFGASFTNNTGSDITSLSISYTGEQWRFGAVNRADRLEFLYSTNATTLLSGTYVAETNLNFTAPVTTGTVGVALDGNSAANRTTISFTITGLNITAGSTFWIRWSDLDATGIDDGLAIDDFSLTASGTPVVPCAEPTTQPTGPISFTASPTSITGNFTAAVPAPDQYLIVRSTSPTLSATPTDGSSYANGDALGGGVVVTSTSLTTFNDNGLTPNTNTYYYFIFSVNNDACGSNYLTTAPLEGNQATPPIPLCVTPAAAPNPITLVAANTSITGSFPTVADANRYLVIISTSPTLSATPIDGATYTAGQLFGGGKIVSFSASNSFTATGLTAATVYYVFAFAANADCTGAPFYTATSSVANTTTTNVTTGIPPGYYNAAAGLTCQPLKTAVRNIIATGSNALSYTPGLWNLYLYSDIHRNDANTADIIWDMYSDNPTGPEPYTYTHGTNQCGTYSVEGNCYNREHSTPQSWFNQVSPMVSDAHHIFATDGKVNGVRSNFPYGEVTSASSTSLNGSKLGTGNNFGYTKTVFEPIDAYKGDFARAGLYMAVRYENEIISQNWSQYGNADSVFLKIADQPIAATRKLAIYDDWYLKLLYKWHIQDPVSQKEIDRNNVIYAQAVIITGTTAIAQGNRNPFIDHPEYAAAIWGNPCLPGLIPVDITAVNAEKNKDAVDVTWNIENEINIYNYEVEKSYDAIHFETAGSVTATNSTSYSFTDNKAQKNGVIYYRIKAMEFSGKIIYSKIVSVKIYNTNGLIIFPNPATSVVNIRFKQAHKAKVNVQITDAIGRNVKNEIVNIAQNNITINTNNFASGKYFVKIINGTEVLNESFLIAK
jgi:endonuclease I